jgi:hypothetical protein
MRHPFQTYTFHIRYTCEACRFGIVPFRQPRSARESVLMMRHLVWIRSKFWQHNPNVLRSTILGVQSENNGVMLLKFCPNLNRASHLKNALSVTLGCV